MWQTCRIYFNPRSHERSDPALSGGLREGHNFNPRSHERSDLADNSLIIKTSLFQSTLPREERRMCYDVRTNRDLYFNPRSHERSDPFIFLGLRHYLHFNPRSHERSDSNIAQKICLFLYNTDNKYIIR